MILFNNSMNWLALLRTGGEAELFAEPRR
jgi:hypothetical protein